MKFVVGPRPPLAGNYRALDEARDAHALYFATMMAQDPRLAGCVLDVGSGAKSPSAKRFDVPYAKIGIMDGVDPRAEIHQNTRLRNRWQAMLEDAPIPAESYDAAVSVFVLEHVSDAASFLKAVHRVLKPGGVFYGLTPHAHHPFPLAVRLIQWLRLKGRSGVGDARVNDYPAYYRCNSFGAIRRAAEAAGFASGVLHYHPAINWDLYFPAGLRFLPHLYDYCVGVRFRPFWQQIFLKLEKAPG